MLQLFVFFLIQRNSSYQQAQILNSSAGVSGWLFQKKNSILQYFNLKKENELLANQDGLTKLANRRSFASHLEQKLATQAKHSSTTLMAI